MDLVAERLGDLLASRLRRRHAGRRLAGGQLECSLRVINGGQPGLSGRWRQLVAAVSPGRLDVRGRWWRPWLRATVPVVALRGPARRESGAEWFWSLPVNSRIIRVETPTATLEWSMLADHLPWALAQVRPPDRPGSGAGADG